MVRKKEMARKKERKLWQVTNEIYGVAWLNISFHDCIWAMNEKEKKIIMKRRVVILDKAKQVTSLSNHSESELYTSTSG